jgi:hypothetical protein
MKYINWIDILKNNKSYKTINVDPVSSLDGTLKATEVQNQYISKIKK